MFIDKHDLSITNSKNSVLTIKNISANLASQISAQNDLTITGNVITFYPDANIRTSHVTFSDFAYINVSSTANKIQSLSLTDANISVPISYTSSGLLQVDDFDMNNKIRIILTHSEEPGETSDKWDSLVNKNITILKTTSASSSINCNNIEVEILKSSGTDPWSNAIYFTKEKFIFDQHCSSQQLSIKLLENPQNIYKQFIYTDEYKVYRRDIQVINSSYKWTNKVTEYTKGIQIYLHKDMTDSIFNINDFNGFKESLQLKFIKSPFEGAKEKPTIQIQTSSLSKETITSLTIQNVILQCLTTTGNIPDINVKQLNVIENSHIKQPFSLSADIVSVQDKLISIIPLSSVNKLNVIPTDNEFNVIFNNDGWTINSTNVNDCSIPSTVSLTIYSETVHRANLTVGDSTTSPLTTTLAFYSEISNIFIDKKFEEMKNMPPISLISSEDSKVLISCNGNYVPIQFTTVSNVIFGTTYHLTTPLSITMPEQKQFSIGKTFTLSFNGNIDQVVFPSFYLRDTDENYGSTTISSNKNVLFKEMRSMVQSNAVLNKVYANKLVVDGTMKTVLKDCSIKNLRIQGELSQVDFPQVELVNYDNDFEEIYIDIEQPSTQYLSSFSRVLITSENSSIDFTSIKSKIHLSSTTFKIGSQYMFISTSLSSNGVYLILSSAPSPTEEPQSSSSSSEEIESSSSDPNEGSDASTAAIAGIVIAVLIICVAAGIIYLFWRRTPNPILDSDYLTVSNDYMLKDVLQP